MIFSEIWTRCERVILLAAFAITLNGIPMVAHAAGQAAGQPDHPVEASLHWESPARMHRADLMPGDHGTLLIDQHGVEFRSRNGHSRRWTFAEIRTTFLAPHRLVLGTYLNHSLHRPGEQKYRFDLTQTLPPSVAAGVAEAVARPSQNADPDAAAPAIATIPVRHRSLASGTNGVLRLREDGIDYVTAAREDSRSWRWADLQTVSDPDPYHLFIFGYRDTYTFDLKAPISRKLLDWVTDRIFTHNASIDTPAMTALHQPERSAAGDRHE